MKDYEDYMMEEEKQSRIQEKLEAQHEEEVWESDPDWQDWQQKQKYLEAQRYDAERGYPYVEDPYEGWPELDYEDDDCYYPECEDDWDYDDIEDDPYGDLLDAGVPDELDDCYRPTAEELYDMYAYACEEECCGDNDDDSYCYLYPRCELCSLYPCHFFLEMQLLSESIENTESECIRRKAVARNRHHASERAKKKAKKSAEILESKLWKLYSEITSRKEANYYRLHFIDRDAFIEGEFLRPNEMRRLYYSEKAATKKANRVKVKTA